MKTKSRGVEKSKSSGVEAKSRRIGPGTDGLSLLDSNLNERSGNVYENKERQVGSGRLAGSGRSRRRQFVKPPSTRTLCLLIPALLFARRCGRAAPSHEGLSSRKHG
jgi:hypothetical protein